MKRLFPWLLIMCVAALLLGCGTRVVESTSEPNLIATVTKTSPTQRPTISALASLILFRDGFQDGNMRWWKVLGGWDIFQDGEAFYILGASSGAAFVPGGLEWTDYVLRAAFRLDYGGVAFNYMLTSSGRYIILLYENGVYLAKESSQGTLLNLAQGVAPTLGEWHWLAIASQEGHLQVYIDRQLIIDVTDPNPLTVGTIGLGSLADSQAFVDDILVTKRIAELSSPETEFQQTAIAPGQTSSPAIQLPVEEVAGPELEEVHDIGSIPTQVVSSEDLRVEASFTVDGSSQATISAGNCAYLAWNVANSLEVTLNDQAVIANSELSVCPTATTIYTLTVLDLNGNTSEIPLTVTIPAGGPPAGAPDIAITSLNVGSGSVDDAVPVNITITNNGGATAANFSVSVIPDGNTGVVGRVMDVAQLPSGVSMTISTDVYYSGPGTYTLAATADCYNATGDSNPSNNGAMAQVTITGGAPPPAEPSGNAPGAPSGCQALAISSTAVQVAWVSGTNMDGYYLFNNNRTVATLPSTASTWIVDGLLPGTTYTFDVVAFNAYGASAASACSTQATTNP